MINKVLMIFDNDILSDKSLGVTKKLLGQYNAFSNLGYDTYAIGLSNGNGVIMHGGNTEILVKKKTKAYFTYLTLLSKAYGICKNNQIDLCYIRYPLADFSFMSMIKKLSKISKVVVETPTFPYDCDLKKESGMLTRFNYVQDKINRNRIKNHIDFFTDFYGHSSIFGAKTVNIDNGIDVNAVSFLPKKDFIENEINIVGVALIVNIHGYDRIIEGLKNYYSNKSNIVKVNFYIVGDGPEAPRLKKMVDEYELKDHIIFTGVKKGKELDDIFKRADVAVASLAAHRRGGKITSELKVKEYCARGIPYIATSVDTAMPKDAPFIRQIVGDDTPVNIQEIVEFAKKCRQNDNLATEMREFAENNLTWEKQLKKVFDEIKQ